MNAAADIADRIDRLPTIPLVADRVSELVNDPGSSARSIAEVMRGDPALTVRVLKLVNSPYFAIPGGVSDITQAISFLGFNTLHQIVLTVSVFSILAKGASEMGHELFRHSVAVAGAGEALAENLGHPAPRECFTAGLLHDLGHLAMLQVAPQMLVSLVKRARDEGTTLLEAERASGVPCHDQLGARLANRWRLPMALQAAIEHHHHSEVDRRSSCPRHLDRTTDVVMLADAIVHRMGFGWSDPSVHPLPASVLERLGCTPEIETETHAAIEQKIASSNVLLHILTSAGAS